MKKAKGVIRSIAGALLIALSAFFLLFTALDQIRLPHTERYEATVPEVSITQLPRMPENWLLNAGDVQSLDDLPGIGPVLAGRIVENREKDGPFYFPEDVMEVKGIGEKRLQDILLWLESNPDAAYVITD